MAEEFRTPWLSDVVDILKRDSTNRIIVGNKEFVIVVRCKDCKFNYANQIPSGDECQLFVELPISKDFFCAWGERREDEAD